MEKAEREEPQPKRVQLHQLQLSPFDTQGDALAHLKTGEETFSDEKSRMVDNAVSYLQVVKEAFKDEPEKHVEFLQVMKDFRLNGVVTNGMINRLKKVFRDHISLLVGLNVFLPKGYEITDPSKECPPKKLVPDYDQAFNYIQKIKTRFQNDDENVYKTFQETLSMLNEGVSIYDLYQQVKLLFCNHTDLIEEFRHFLPEPMDSAHDLHLQDSERPASGPISGLNSGRYSHKESMVKGEQTVDTNNNHKQSFRCPLIEDFERTSVDIENGHLKKIKKEKDHKEDCEWNVKDGDEKTAVQYRDTELDVMYQHPHGKKVTSRSDYLLHEKRLMGQVNGSTSEHSQQDPSMDCSKTLMNVSTQKRDFCNKVKRKIVVTGLEKENERNTEQHHEKDRHGDNDRPRRSRDKLNNNASPISSKDKVTNMPFSELCLSDCERCTPSYCLLPENYPKPVASYCTDLAAEVLNDCCVTMTSGSEDNSFKHMRKNRYEESLFRCEDDRFELDMLIESTAATIMCIKELLEKLNDITIKRDNHIQIEEHLTAINLRCIEKLYGDHGLEAIDMLRENPSRALPVIQTRLQQKKDEWSNCCAEFNKIWADVYAKNHQKSLDHRSFYFKPQDKKSFSTRS